MKALRTAIIAFGSILSLASSCSSSRPLVDATAVKNIVDSQQYTFVAQSVQPNIGRNRQLTSDYSMKVSKDSVSTDLPYFGRAYTAPMDPNAGGIRFTSTKFGYNKVESGSGKWDVTITPGDVSGVQQLNLIVFENGSATLQVNSTNRQPISYRGYISRKRP